MGPEFETQISPANLQAANNRAEAAIGRFALAYARGANMFAFIRNAFTGRPDEATTAADQLRPAILQASEYRGRDMAAGAPTLGDFRADLAIGTARAHQDLTDEVVEASTEAVQTPGMWTGMSRIWSGPDGDFLKVITTGALGGLHFFGNLGGNTGDIVSHVAFASVAITTMDVGKRAILETTTRYVGAMPNRLAELIRRKASDDEGYITGDVFPYAGPRAGQVIAGELEDRAEDNLRTNLENNDIQRPPLTRYDQPWTSRLREVIASSLEPYDQVGELIRSRDISVRSRLARTILAAAVLAGTTAHYFANRPAQLEVNADNCPMISFPTPNSNAEGSLGLNNIASLTGMAQNMFFKRAYGVDFDHSPKHAELLQKLIDQDKEGNEKIIKALVTTLKEENPRLRFVTTDNIRITDAQGKTIWIVGICNQQEEDEIYNKAIKSLDR